MKTSRQKRKKKKKWKNSFCCSMSFRRKTVDRQTFVQPNNTWYHLFKCLLQLFCLRGLNVIWSKIFSRQNDTIYNLFKYLLLLWFNWVPCYLVKKYLANRHLANPTILGTICPNAYYNCCV